MTVHIRKPDTTPGNGYARTLCGKVAWTALVPTLADWRAYPVGRLCRRCIQVGVTKEVAA